MKRTLKAILPAPAIKKIADIKNDYFGGYAIKSYSQEGEDMILHRFFGGKSKGFYVDVGAHHPLRFSNTWFFYKMGWHGINIDAKLGSMKLFNKLRKRDLNLEVPILNSSQDITYYMFSESAVNTFSKDLAEKILNRNNYSLVGTINVRPKKLSEVLDEHMPHPPKIDFLSIDVEGLDFEVLMSNDWNKYRPTMVLVEQLATSLHDLSKDKIALFMKEKNYSLYAKTNNTVFYLESDSTFVR
jgi:FkbM family methyltransferase